MKKLAILYSEYSPVIDAIINQLQDVAVECFTELPENYQTYNLVVSLNYRGEEDVNLLKCHHSLLPAFNSEEPVRDAFLAGVKVTGITIYYTRPQKIIAQYPLFIPNDAHFDDIEKQLCYLEQVIFPIVIEKLLKNEPFDIRNISKFGGKCEGCSGCSH